MGQASMRKWIRRAQADELPRPRFADVRAAALFLRADHRHMRRQRTRQRWIARVSERIRDSYLMPGLGRTDANPFLAATLERMIAMEIHTATAIYDLFGSR